MGKKESEILRLKKWFKIENYDCVSDFEVPEIAAALSNRYHIYKSLNNILQEKDQAQRGRLLSQYVNPYYQDILCGRIKPLSSFRAESVTPLFCKELMYFSKKLKEHNDAGSEEAKPEELLNYENLSYDKDFRWRERIENKMDEPFDFYTLGSPRGRYESIISSLQVNLSASDERIIEDMRFFLKEYRQILQMPEYNPKSLSGVDVNGIHKTFISNFKELKYLAILDIELWGILNNMKIQSRHIAELVFFNDQRATTGVPKWRKDARKSLDPKRLAALSFES